MDGTDNHSNLVVWRLVRHVEIFDVWVILNKVTDKILGLQLSRVIMALGAGQG